MLSKLLPIVLIARALAAPQNPPTYANEPNRCDATCQIAYRQVLAMEEERWVNQDITLDPFYSTPSNVSKYSTGDILKWEKIPAEQAYRRWTVPAGISLTRFYYMSEDIEGKPLPATGIVLIPYTNPQGSKPFRTVVWTHGTAGGTRQCSPSNHRALLYGWTAPFALALAGYVVIAPDYAGQGSEAQGFQYEAGILHAADASLSVQAVRKALGSKITKEWVVVGHSEGGMSSWRTNEREAKTVAVGGLLGAVALSPGLVPSKIIGETIRRAANGGPAGDFLSSLMLQTVSRIYPSLKVEDYASDILLARMPLADQGCFYTSATLYSNLTISQLYKNTSWIEHPDFIKWEKVYNGAGPHKLAAPMLVIQGAEDPIVYPDTSEEAFNETCKAFASSTTAEFRLYPGLGHGPVLPASQQYYLSWIEDRFNKVSLKKGCKKLTMTPETDNFSPVNDEWVAVFS
ncbi:secretory lipase [Fusarium subglutinans]|uniref:Secretory lipase n=1 Tax=Gibberella subglutinans TaxID=42677 RepID=A0A8H5LBN1_GIBSU|nr:secretory lipase [Fusarium subglutinans]KAF5590010.1 secretory lipase [Fusarium subglutinans]